MGKKRSVHRVICESVHGRPPRKHEASHSCGKGHLGCVNPKHLSWKTSKQNGEDMINHGTSLRGKHPMAKLSEINVQAIKMLKGKMLQSEVAEKFNTRQDMVSRIWAGKRWSWVKCTQGKQ